MLERGSLRQGIYIILGIVITIALVITIFELYIPHGAKGL